MAMATATAAAASGGDWWAPLYVQPGWSPSAYPLMEVALAIAFATYVFDTYVDWRQHRLYTAVTEVPADLARMLRGIMVPVKQGGDKDKDGSGDGDDDGAKQSAADADADGDRADGDGDSGAAPAAPVPGPVEVEDLGERTAREFPKSQAYGHDKSTFAFVKDAFAFVENGFLFALGFMPWAWDMASWAAFQTGFEPTEHEIVVSMFFVVLVQLQSTVTALPFSIYHTFVIEERHGFNKQTPWLFFTDLVKESLVSAAVGLPIMSLLIWVIQSMGEFFYLWATGMMLMVTVLLMFIWPSFIAPLFNKFTPLEEGPLKTAIMDLASSLSFPLKKLFVVDGSRRSSHSNAYLFGFCGNKRIVLYDTLLKQASQEEIVAILGHELGHWKKSHTLRLMASMQVLWFLRLFGFSWFMHNQDLFAAFGFATVGGKFPTIIGLTLFLSVAFAPLEPLLRFANSFMSRLYEFQADAFAAELGHAEPLKTGLVKISVENLGALAVDPLYSAYHHSHPPLIERMRAIDAHVDAMNADAATGKRKAA